jgi:glycosyltransferase involved in cell wall biosynthesis
MLSLDQLPTTLETVAMRICLLSREYPPDTGWGGIATFARHLAHGLKEIGHDVVVISMAKPGAAASTGEHEGIKIHRVEPYIKEGDLGLLGRATPNSRFTLSAVFALWAKFLELHQEQPFDVLDTPELLAEGLMPALSKIAPLVVRLYTPHFKFIVDGLHNTKHTIDHHFIGLAERFALLNADAITSPSKDLAEFVANDLHYPLEQIKIIMNPIDVGEFHPAGPCKIVAEGKLKILFVGRLEERKGINYLIETIPEVVKKYPNAHYYVIGDDTITGKGHTSVLNELKKFIQANNCHSNVTFMPRVPLVDLPQYYRSADICVVPSLYDNSPYSALEAMSCGRPVIGTNSGGTKEYMVAGESGLLVPPKDTPALTEALINLLGSESERKRLGENARARVLERFQRAEIARQTVEVYKEAQSSFETSKLSPQYRRSPADLLADADSLLNAFHETIHDVLYSFSWRYRAAYWVHLIKKRPRLFAAKIALKAFQKIGSLPGFKGETMTNKIAWLETQVNAKQVRQSPVPPRLNTASSETK